ncbi:MAG: mechanosensitive ion channel family protein [Acidobacteriota bacterium]
MPHPNLSVSLAQAAPPTGSDPDSISPPRVLDLLPPEVLKGWTWLEESPLLAALTVAVCGYIVAKITELTMRRIVARLARKTTTQFDDKVVELLRRPVFLTVFLFALAIAFELLRLPPQVTRFTVNVLQTLVVLTWLGAGFPICGLVLDTLSRHRDRFRVVEERTIPLFDMISKLILVGGASYAILLVWHIDPTAWLASAGVIGIAVGFAARDTLANLFAGFFILADAPYKLGDFVTLDSGERGLVTHVGMRSTRLLTRDDIEITMPNQMIANAKILNESGGRWEKERIRIKVGVAYGSDVDQIVELLLRVARDHEHICPDPEPRVRLRAFGDSSLDFELLCWIDEPVLRGKLSHEMLMAIYKLFAQEGVEIPFPQRDVWMRQAPTASTEVSEI